MSGSAWLATLPYQGMVGMANAPELIAARLPNPLEVRSLRLQCRSAGQLPQDGESLSDEFSDERGAYLTLVGIDVDSVKPVSELLRPVDLRSSITAPTAYALQAISYGCQPLGLRDTKRVRRLSALLRPSPTLRYVPGLVRALANAAGHPPLYEALRSLRSSGTQPCLRPSLRTRPSRCAPRTGAALRPTARARRVVTDAASALRSLSGLSTLRSIG
jgi:hypothetical protein